MSRCPFALQGLYLIAYRFASGLGPGRATTFSYAYLIAAFLVSVTAASIALVATVPFAREGSSPERVAKHVVASSWLSLAPVAAAAGVFALAGETVARHVLGPSYGGGTGAELGRLVVYLSPWMVASVAVTVTYPLIFVRGRAGWLPVLALAALVAQVAIDWALRAAFDLGGVAAGLAVTTALVLAVLLVALGAVRRVVVGVGARGARVRRARRRQPSGCRGSSSRPFRPPRWGSCCTAAPSRSGGPRDCATHGRTCARCSSVRAVLNLKQLVRRAGRTSPGKNLIHASVLSDPATMRFRERRAVAGRPARVRGSGLSLLVEPAEPRCRVAADRRGSAALPARPQRRHRPDRGDRALQGWQHVHLRHGDAEGVELWSYDFHVALRPDMPGAQLDAELREALDRYGLAHKVHLIVADSRTAIPPDSPLEVLFIDGDHSYEGAKADFERWGAFVRKGGGHLLFHDAVDSGGYGNFYPGIAQLMTEIGAGWERQAGAGSIAHFIRSA